MGCFIGLHCYSDAKSKGYTALPVCIFRFKLGSIHNVLNFMLEGKKKLF